MPGDGLYPDVLPAEYQRPLEGGSGASGDWETAFERARRMAPGRQDEALRGINDVLHRVGDAHLIPGYAARDRDAMRDAARNASPADLVPVVTPALRGAHRLYQGMEHRLAGEDPSGDYAAAAGHLGEAGLQAIVPYWLKGLSRSGQYAFDNMSPWGALSGTSAKEGVDAMDQAATTYTRDRLSFPQRNLDQQRDLAAAIQAESTNPLRAMLIRRLAGGRGNRPTRAQRDEAMRSIGAEHPPVNPPDVPHVVEANAQRWGWQPESAGQYMADKAAGSGLLPGTILGGAMLAEPMGEAALDNSEHAQDHRDAVAHRKNVEAEKKGYGLYGETPPILQEGGVPEKDKSTYRTEIPGVNDLIARKNSAAGGVVGHTALGLAGLGGAFATLPWALRSTGRAMGETHYGLGESIGDLGMEMGGGLPINAILQGLWGTKALAIPGGLAYLAYDQAGKGLNSLKQHDFEKKRLSAFLRSAQLPGTESPMNSPDADPGYLPK